MRPSASARLGVVAAMIYLLFNEGYSASGGDAHIRLPLCEEAIRLARLLLQLFPSEAEIMGLTALFLLQHARAAARLDADGRIVLLEDQDRRRWDRALIAEGTVLIEKAMRHRRPGPFQIQAAIAAVHAAAARADDTDWAEIDQLYQALERLQPSPVVSLNRAVAVAKLRGPEAALAMIEPLAAPLAGYFHFHGLKGAIAEAGRPRPARHAPPSPPPWRSPTRPPRPRTSACRSTGCDWIEGFAFVSRPSADKRTSTARRCRFDNATGALQIETPWGAKGGSRTAD